MADLNGMGFGHMFPYSNLHELNIDWMLNAVKELEGKVSDLLTRMSEAEQKIDDHDERITNAEQRLDDYQARIEALEADFLALRAEWEAFKVEVNQRLDDFESEIRTLFADLSARIDAQFATLEAEINAKFAALEHKINDDFTALEAELRGMITTNLQYIIDTCADFTERVTRLTVRVEAIEENMDECCLTITGKLDDILTTLDTINPVLREIVITENGVYLSDTEGADGYYKVTVNVPPAVLEQITITTNGTYTPPAGVDGYNSITVNTPTTFETEEKSVTINTNGTTNVTPSSGKDAMTKVTVTTNVQPSLQQKTVTVTQNGTTNVTPDSGKDGLSKVVVNTNVPSNVYNNHHYTAIGQSGSFKKSKYNLPQSFSAVDVVLDADTNTFKISNAVDSMNGKNLKNVKIVISNIMAVVTKDNMVTVTKLVCGTAKIKLKSGNSEVEIPATVYITPPNGFSSANTYIPITIVANTDVASILSTIKSMSNTKEIGISDITVTATYSAAQTSVNNMISFTINTTISANGIFAEPTVDLTYITN